MESEDVRWIQRFNNYKRALGKLSKAVDNSLLMTDLEKEGLIKRFEYTFQMAWSTLQDLLVMKGYAGERDKPNIIFKQAYEQGYIKDYTTWKAMTQSRNRTSHTYDEETANEIADQVVDIYHDLFVQLETRLQVERLNQEKKG